MSILRLFLRKEKQGSEIRDLSPMGERGHHELAGGMETEQGKKMKGV
jgi:hypothetical protein